MLLPIEKFVQPVRLLPPGAIGSLLEVRDGVVRPNLAVLKRMCDFQSRLCIRKRKRKATKKRREPRFLPVADWIVIVIVIVISKLLKRYSKTKRTRAPAYSRAL